MSFYDNDSYVHNDGNGNYTVSSVPIVGNIKSRTDITDLEDIREIPKIEWIHRLKARRELRSWRQSYKYYLSEVKKIIRKIKKIDNKMERYRNYPDEIVGKKNLYSQKTKLKELLREKREGILKQQDEIFKYSKALGKEVTEDFSIIETIQEYTSW